jgi:hypothetical protein
MDGFFLKKHLPVGEPVWRILMLTIGPVVERKRKLSRFQSRL